MKAANTRDSISLVNPYRFGKPLAPFIAAEQEGKRIKPERICGAFKKLSNRHDFMIVEGAGGIMVPLTERCSYLDLAKMLGLPVLIVARPGLGTINHTLLTITALRQRGITAQAMPHLLDSLSSGCQRATRRTRLPGVRHQRQRFTPVRVGGRRNLPPRRPIKTPFPVQPPHFSGGWIRGLFSVAAKRGRCPDAGSR